MLEKFSDWTDAVSTPRDMIEGLLAELEQLERELASWQSEPGPTPETIEAGRRRYMDWYQRASRHAPAEDRDRFRDMYEGGSFVRRIKGFLLSPRAESVVFNASEPNPFIPRWDVPFEDKPRESLFTQREILLSALHHVAAPSAVLDELDDMFRRLPSCLSVLRNANRERVPPPDLHDEADLQVLVHALLRLRYADVRAEDHGPVHAGRSSRPDFVLPEARVAIETKFIRQSLLDGRLGDELLQDLGRYPEHPDCDAIFILVYDPRRLLTNPTGMERDLSRDSGPTVRAVVVH